MKCSGFLNFTDKNNWKVYILYLISGFKHFNVSIKNIIDFSILNQTAFIYLFGFQLGF